MGSQRIVNRKILLSDKENNLLGIIQIVIWRVDDDENYPCGIKYRIVFAKRVGEDKFDGDFLRYDNEKWKGSHIHRKGKEYPYEFKDIESLIDDFLKDLGDLLGLNIDEILERG